MSHATLYKVPASGPIVNFREFSNAHGGAPFIWAALSKKHLRLSLFRTADDQLWLLAKSPDVKRSDRIVHAMTFDNVLVAKKNFIDLAECLDEFDKDHPGDPGVENHIKAFSQAVKDLAKEPDAEALCWCQTSVCGDVWWVEEEPAETLGRALTGGRRFDLSIDHPKYGSWFLFDREDIAGPDRTVIPKGIYCYDKKGLCPYWSIDENKEGQNNGYCAFMKKGDWELEGGLLWDQCKECGVNNDFDIRDYVDQPDSEDDDALVP